MRKEYDFQGGERGKHYKAMQDGYTVTIHKADGSVAVKDMEGQQRSVILEPDVQAYFPDSESVNKALRCLIPLLSQKTKVKAQKP